MTAGGSTWVGVKAAAAALGVAGCIAAAAGALCVVVVGVSLVTLVRSAIGPGVSGPGAATDYTQAAKSHNEAFAKYLAQWDGRSLMIVPGRPTPPPPPQPEHHDEPVVARAPTSYGGPAIIAMLMDTVWFDDGTRMSVGDDPKDDLEVVDVRAPWEAGIKWKGVQFTVPLFARDEVVIKPGGGSVQTDPGSTPTAPTTPPTIEADAKTTASKPKPEQPKPLAAKPAPAQPAPPPPPSADGGPAATPAEAPEEPEPGPDNGPQSSQSKPPAGGDGGR